MLTSTTGQSFSQTQGLHDLPGPGLPKIGFLILAATPLLSLLRKQKTFLALTAILLTLSLTSFGAGWTWVVRVYTKPTCNFPTGIDLNDGVTPTVPTLYAIVMGSDGKVLQTQEMNVDFLGSKAAVFVPLTQGQSADTTDRQNVDPGTYTSFQFAVSSNRPAIGSFNPTPTLPADWVFTGNDAFQHPSATVIPDGAPFGIVTPTESSPGTIGSVNIYININKKPLANPYTADVQVNPGATGTTLSTEAFSGSDVQDGSYAPGLMGKSVNLLAASNGTLYYNNSPVSTSLAVSSFDPLLVKLVPSPTVGAVTSSFQYAVQDAACAFSANALLTVPFLASCSLTVSATPGTCQSATNSYTLSGIVSLTNSIGGGPVVITDGANSTTVTAAANATSVVYSFTGLASGTGSHTVTASLSSCGNASVTYTAPTSCSVAPCGLAMLVTPGICQSATNSYVLSGTINATNVPTSGTLTITSGAFSAHTLTMPPAANVSGAFSYSGLVSNGQAYTVTASYSNSACPPVSQTYTAPASCSVVPVCSLSATVTAGLCASATNTYSASVVVNLSNAPAGTLTLSLPGSAPLSLAVGANTPSLTAVLTGLLSDGASHTLTVSLPGCGTTTASFTAPLSCSLAPACSITAVATAGTCASATNTYSATAIVMVLNPIAGNTVTVSTGGQSLTFSATATNQNTFTAVFTGLLSDGASHTLTVNLPGCGTVNATYTAPASCSAVPVCSLSATATAGLCASATNTYSASVVVNLSNAPAGTLTLNLPGSAPLSLAVGANTPSLTAVMTGLLSDGASHILTVSLPGCGTTTASFTAPLSCSLAPACSITAVATAGPCQSPANSYSSTVVVTIKNPISGTLTISDGPVSTTFATAATSSASFTATFIGLAATGTTHTVVAALAGCSTISTTYTAPASCSQPAGASLSLDKRVDKSQAKLGDVLTYTLVLTNSGTATATNVIVRDSMTTGLTYVSNSVTTPTGTTFTQGSPISIWTLGSIAPGQSFSLTLQARADSAGVLYNRTTISGDTVTVCTSIPILVCTGDLYVFRLTAAPGRTSYRWFRDNVELTSQTTNTLDVTAPGIYSLALDNVSGKCPDFSCCPFIVVEDTLPSFQAAVLPATCAGNSAQANGKLVLSNFRPSYTYQYSLGTDFNPGASLSGAAQVIPVGGVIATTLANPAVAQAFTIRVYNQSGCYTDVTVTLQPTSCCNLSVVTTAGLCEPASNTYLSTAVITLTNTPAGTLTVSDGPASTTFATAATSSASFTATFIGLAATGTTHTVVTTLAGCSTTSTTYTAPASCSAGSTPGLALQVTPGLCQSATNAYSMTGTLSLTNAVAGTAIVTDGPNSTTLSVSAGATSIAYSLTGLPSGTGVHMVLVSYLGQTASTTYTAPASCLPAPVCSLSATVTAGLCASATNTYSASVVVNLSNAPAGTLTLNLPGSAPLSLALGANTPSLTAVLTGLLSDGASHTLTVSLPGCGTTTASFTAPLSCSLAPACSITAVTTAGSCASATNTYSATAIVTVLNPVVGNTVTVSSGGQSLTFSTGAASQGTFTAVFAGLVPDGATHTVTASLPGCGTVNATYTAPASCSVVPVCSLSATATAGLCASATNTYSASVVVNLSNAPAGTLTLSLPGSAPLSLALGANTPSLTAVLTGLLSDGVSHTVTVSLPGCGSVNANFTAPVSCSVTPVCSLTSLVTAGPCNTLTNTFSSTVLVTIVNPTSGTLTITNAGSNDSQSQHFTINPSITSLTAVFPGIISDGASHTITASLPGCSTTSTTYTAPTHCQVKLGLALTDPGLCQPGTNTYSTTGIISLANALAGTAIVTDGPNSTTLSVSAGATSIAYSLTGLPSGTGVHMVLVSYLGQTASTTYTAPASCLPAPVCSLSATVTAGLCASATNTYSASVVVNLSNAPAGTLTLSLPGSAPLSLALGANTPSLTAVLTGLLSDGVSHTVMVSLPGCGTTTASFTAPLSCSLAPACSITAVATAVPVTCIGTMSQPTGKIVLSGFTSGYTYQYSGGVIFNPAVSLSGAVQAIPVGGVIVNNLVNPAAAQAYTVRIYKATGCYVDRTVMLLPTICTCPVDVCLPLVISHIKRAPRIGIPR